MMNILTKFSTWILVYANENEDFDP